MINKETVQIALKLNTNDPVNIARCFHQNDNHVANLSFTISHYNDTAINYNEIQSAYLILRFPDGSFMEPCKCVVNANSITYELCAHALSEPGTVTGVLRIYGEGEQVFTTNIFSFVIIADMLDGHTLSNIEKVSLINDLIADLNTSTTQENLRVIAENNRVSAEAGRVTAESNRNQTFGEAMTQFAGIVSEFDTMKEEHSGFSNSVNTIQNDVNQLQSNHSALSNKVDSNLNRMVLFDIESNNETTIDKVLLSAPTGYRITVTSATIISRGSALGLTDTETSTLQLKNGETVISEVVFNDVIGFPTNNSTYAMTITSGEVLSEETISINMANMTGVNTPEFTVQINYDIIKN